MNYGDIFSLSTSWNAKKHVSGRTMVEEMKRLGFKKVELNYLVTRDMAEEIIPMTEKGEIEVTSIHNVFPRITDEAYGTDSLLLGYTDEEKRKKSVELTIGSVEYAARFNARAVVIHPGEINLPKDYNSLLENMILKGEKDTAEYSGLLKEMLDLRRKGRDIHVRLIRDSLEEICEYIAKKGYKVALGIENRTMCHQIPDYEEAHIILDGLKGLPVYFWYDVGHGMLMEQMGLFKNFEGASALKDRTIGMHIHDIIKCDDHLCPCLHSDKLDKFLDLIRDVPIKVLELNQRFCKADDIKKSAGILYEKLAAIGL